MSERSRDRLYLLFAIGLAFVPYRELFTERVPVGRDLLYFFYPLKAHLAESVLMGELPWIDRFRWGGVPLLGNPGSAPFDPANLLFLVLPLGTAMKVWQLLHLVIGVTGFAAFSRRWGLSGPSAAVAGLAFGLTGVSVSLVNGLTSAAALSIVPWMAAFVIDVRRKPGFSPIARLAVAAALVLAASSPEVAIHAALLSAAVAFGPSPEDETPRPLRQAVPALVVAALLALALAAPAVLTSAATAARSVRGKPGAMTLDYSAQRALPVKRLPELALDGVVADWTTTMAAPGIPDYPYFPSLTPGRVALPLALLGLLLGGAGRRRAVSLAAAGALLALGAATPVWTLAAKALPLLQKIRYPEKHAVLYALGAAWLVALGLRALERRVRPEVFRFVLPALAVAILLDRERVARRLVPMDAPTVLTAAPPVLAPLLGRPSPTPPRIFHRDTHVAVPFRYMVAPVDVIRFGRSSLLPFYPSLFGVGAIFDRDYDLSLPIAVVNWEKMLPTALATPSPVPYKILRAAGVEAVVRTEVDGYRRIPRLELLDPVPPFRFVSRVVSDEPVRLFHRLLQEGCDPATSYVQEPAGPLPERPSAGRILSLRDSPSALSLEVEVEGPAPGFLALYRLKEAVQEAELDGRPVSVSGAGFGFAGITVPPGRHTLRLRPETGLAKIGALVSAMSSLVLIGGALWTMRKQASAA